MTREILIVGTGPAAVGAALSALASADTMVTIIDIGERLEAANDAARRRLSTVQSSQWESEDVGTISRLPVASDVRGLPEKRSYGSDYPFRDSGQLDEITALRGANRSVVSGAYGGFSNVWGAQVMPFTSATFRDWPFGMDRLEPHYAAILRHIPFAAEQDDLAERFPLISRAENLPTLSERSRVTMARYERHRSRIRRQRVILGAARLAMEAGPCVRCGLCLTGCPYKFIYSASHSMDRLRRDARVTYVSGFLATHIHENGAHASITAVDLATGASRTFTGDRAFVACGAIGTTRLVLGSLELFDIPASVGEAAQFTLPFVSMSPTTDPRAQSDFTLNQFNMTVDTDGAGYNLSQLHFYTYSHAFLGALPGVIQGPRMTWPRSETLRRVSVALGYLPSWQSPRFELRAHRASNGRGLPLLTIDGGNRASFASNRMLRDVLSRIVRVAPSLDLWPVLPSLRFSAPGKSYHWGCTFPHSAAPHGPFASDVLGRVGGWQRVHLVDASVFPTVASTTFTLTVMANAHRIATEALRS